LSGDAQLSVDDDPASTENVGDAGAWLEVMVSATASK
jgi:hypothetical protein